VLTEIDPTERCLYDLFGLGLYDPKRWVGCYTTTSQMPPLNSTDASSGRTSPQGCREAA